MTATPAVHTLVSRLPRQPVSVNGKVIGQQDILREARNHQDLPPAEAWRAAAAALVVKSSSSRRPAAAASHGRADRPTARAAPRPPRRRRCVRWSRGLRHRARGDGGRSAYATSPATARASVRRR